MRKTLIKVLTAGAVVLPLAAFGQTSEEGSLFFSSTEQGKQVGDVFEVKLMANSGSDQVNAVTADFTYDASNLQLLSISDENSQFKAKFFECWSGGNALSCPPGQVPQPGVVYITRAVQPYGQSVGGANLEVVSLTFKVLVTGPASLGFGGGAKLAYVNVTKGTQLQTTSYMIPSASARALEVSCHFNRDLEIGTGGEDVRCLQKYLNGLGHIVAASGPGSLGNESDYFGSRTKAAIMKWQKANGLPMAGRFGPMSRARFSAMMMEM